MSDSIDNGARDIVYNVGKLGGKVESILLDLEDYREKLDQSLLVVPQIKEIKDDIAELKTMIELLNCRIHTTELNVDRVYSFAKYTTSIITGATSIVGTYVAIYELLIK